MNEDRTPLYVAETRVENFQRIELIEVTLSPTGLTEVTGQNRQGKSSFLNALVDALAGSVASADPAVRVRQPIRDGAKSSRVRLTLCRLNPDGTAGEPELIVERRRTLKGGNYLTVSAAEGGQHTRPQELLDSLLGHLGASNPLDFVRLKGRDQVDALLRLVEYPDVSADLKRLGVIPADGQDVLAAIAEAKQSAFTYRTEVNRNADRLRKAHGEIHLPAGWRTLKPVDVAGLLEMQTRLLAQQRSRQEVEMRLSDLLSRVEAAEQRVTRLEAELEQAREELNRGNDALLAASAERDRLTDPTAELAQVGQQLREAETINAACRNVERAAELDAQATGFEQESDGLTAKLTELDALKERILTGAKMPIDGLSYDPAEGVVLYQGRPLSDCSWSEKLRVGLAILFAENPRLRFVRLPENLIDALDAEGLAWLDAEARQRGFPVLAERVLREGRGGLVIHEGRLVQEEAGDEAHS
ncbi:hypothetical protein FJY71_01265 [candidate division WOR-3 bacterium]|nr:hypothetical protein [candidate division WOR-3 bacterium]